MSSKSWSVGTLLFGRGTGCLRGFGLQLFHRNTPEAVGMVGRLSVSMIFVGLLQALAMWSLASRWTKISLLYGGSGIGYWILILVLGKTPAALLEVMPAAAAAAFIILFVCWMVAVRRQPPATVN